MDLKEIERILELMREHELVEVELDDHEKGVHLKFRKSPPPAPLGPTIMPTLAAPVPMPMMPAAVTAVAAPGGPETVRKERDPNLVDVPSPMVGTFYRAPSPDANPYVEVGQRIGEETVVCIIEAMKVMNEIKAEVAGEVVEILVQNGEAVEFGQPLFVVRRG